MDTFIHVHEHVIEAIVTQKSTLILSCMHAFTLMMTAIKAGWGKSKQQERESD